MYDKSYYYLKSQYLLKCILDCNKPNKKIKINRDISWILISTCLLISENTLKKHKVYELFSEDEYIMLENVIEKTIFDKDYENLESYILDANNNVINEFHNLIPFFEEEKITGFDKKILDSIRKCECNDSIITNSIIDYKKLIKRIRNSIAHSNYEVLDSEYLRLYHYNQKGELDFNCKINIILILTVIDEINEMAAKLYQPIVIEFFNRMDDIHYTTHELTTQEIISHLHRYNLMTDEDIQEILDEAKESKLFYPNYETDNNFYKMGVIYDIAIDKFIDASNYGFVLDEIIYKMNKNNEFLNNYFYEKHGFYQYLNSDTIYLKDKMSSTTYKETFFKIFVLAYMNCLFLYNFNTNESIDYDKLDFSRIKIDDKFKETYISKLYKSIEEDNIQLENKEKKLKKILQNIKKLEQQKKSAKTENEFVTTILPSRIEELKENYKELYKCFINGKIAINEKMYSKLFEIIDIKDNKNLKGDISRYILNHLRNSLAHGYVSFPDPINLKERLNTTILIEDYDYIDNKKVQTFKATITLKELIYIINNKNNIDVLFNTKEANAKKNKIISTHH